MKEWLVSAQRISGISLLDVLLTTDSRLRMSLITTGLACLFMAFCILVVELLATTALIDHQWVRWWSLSSGACVLGSFALIRSGATRDWDDPAFTSVQMIYGITSNAVAYVIAGSSRGITPPLLAVAMMFAVFSLRPQQIKGLMAYGLLAYGVAAAVVQWGLPYDPMPASLAAVYLLVVVMVLTMTTILSLRANTMRERLQIQKSELAEAVAQIHEMATRDELTGLPNRRYMQDMLRLEELRARRNGQPLLVAQLDLDFFKKVNDSYGHAAGDQVLQDFSRRVASCVRAADVWARWGGEEFVLLMPNTSQADGEVLLERVRAKVASMPAQLPSGVCIAYTVSIGAAQLREGEGAMTLLERTDTALYAAKGLGRNRVEWAQGEPTPKFKPNPNLAAQARPVRGRVSPSQPGDLADCTTRSSYPQTEQ